MKLKGDWTADSVLSVSRFIFLYMIEFFTNSSSDTSCQINDDGTRLMASRESAWRLKAKLISSDCTQSYRKGFHLTMRGEEEEDGGVVLTRMNSISVRQWKYPAWLGDDDEYCCCCVLSISIRLPFSCVYYCLIETTAALRREDDASRIQTRPNRAPDRTWDDANPRQNGRRLPQSSW